MHMHKLIIAVLLASSLSLGQVRAQAAAGGAIEFKDGDLGPKILEVSNQELVFAVNPGQAVDYGSGPSTNTSFNVSLGGCTVKLSPYDDSASNQVRVKIEGGGNADFVSSPNELVVNATHATLKGGTAAGGENKSVPCTPKFTDVTPQGSNATSYTIEVELSGNVSKNIVFTAQNAKIYSSSEVSEGISTGPLVGIIVGVLVLVAVLVIAFAVVYLKFWRKKSKGLVNESDIKDPDDPDLKLKTAEEGKSKLKTAEEGKSKMRTAEEPKAKDGKSAMGGANENMETPEGDPQQSDAAKGKKGGKK